jgi:hypothetical protein
MPETDKHCFVIGPMAMKAVPSVFTLTGCSRVSSFRCSNDPGQLASVAAQIRDEVE